MMRPSWTTTTARCSPSRRRSRGSNAVSIRSERRSGSPVRCSPVAHVIVGHDRPAGCDGSGNEVDGTGGVLTPAAVRRAARRSTSTGTARPARTRPGRRRRRGRAAARVSSVVRAVTDSTSVVRSRASGRATNVCRPPLRVRKSASTTTPARSATARPFAVTGATPIGHEHLGRQPGGDGVVDQAELGAAEDQRRRGCAGPRRRRARSRSPQAATRRARPSSTRS